VNPCKAAAVAALLLAAACAASPETSDPADPEDPPASLPTDCAGNDGCMSSGVATPTAPAPSAPAPVITANALPVHYPLRVLQLNLCNSGLAGCFDGGKSVPEAATVIASNKPDVVTLNEICQPDVVTLSATLANAFSGSTVVWAFKAAADRRTGAAYKCKNGQDYGIGLIAHIPGTFAGSQIFSGIYASQDTTSSEERAWLCIDAVGSFYACTTHLASTSGTVALNQCKDLMNNLIPAVHTSGGANAPTVVGGDLNLKFGGSPNAQSCVPPGYFRKGDGSVQHIMASTDLVFSSSKSINMDHTDHDGWLVALTAP
jgi:hypothetical protein